MIIDCLNTSKTARNKSNECWIRNVSSRGTLVVVPKSRLMARNRQIVTINSFAGDVGAAGNDVVDDIVASSHLQSLSPASFQKIFYKTGLVQALLKLVCKYQYEDEDSQNKLYELINAHFGGEKPSTARSGETNVKFSNNLLQYFENAIEIAKNSIECETSTLLLNPRIILNNALRNVDNSVIYLFEKPKYCEIFSNIEKIGKGGGGRVFKGRHNVDQCYYAIKIIPLPMQQKLDEVLKEAVYLAKLQHPNIVMYKTAWLDYCTDQDCIGSSESSPVSNTNELSSQKSSNLDSFLGNPSTSACNCYGDGNSDNSVVFEEPGSNNAISVTSWKNEILKENPRKLLRSVSCEQPKLTNLELRSAAVVKYKTKYSVYKGQGDGSNYLRNCNFEPTANEVCQPVLVIQMELCCYTLRDLLDKRIQSALPTNVYDLVDAHKMLDILRCVLIAVQYCHDMDYIHRDLKPSNIFFDKNGVVKIGDFGLATTKILNEIPTSTECVHLSHTSNIGTKPYAAPEQLDGSKYNYKVDMHSLGIIIIELFYPFYTGMERNIIFDQFKNGQVPETFKQKWPKQASLILKLLSADPSKRPDAKEILSSDLFHQSKSDTQSNQHRIPDIIITPAEKLIESMDFETLKLYTKQIETQLKSLQNKNDCLQNENDCLRKRLNEHNLF